MCVADEAYYGVLFGCGYVCWKFCYGVGFVVGGLLWLAPELFSKFLDLLFLFSIDSTLGCSYFLLLLFHRNRDETQDLRNVSGV